MCAVRCLTTQPFVLRCLHAAVLAVCLPACMVGRAAGEPAPAQVSGDAVIRAKDVAEERWQAFSGKRSFELERVTLVQNTMQNNWRNLQEFSLRTPVIAWT